MADAATTADAVRTGIGTPDDHSFLWRRLHSLSGVLPLGAFLCYHVFENLSALRGALLSVATLSVLFQMRFGAVG